MYIKLTVWCHIHNKHMINVINYYYVHNNVGGLLLGTLCITSFNPPSNLKRGYYSHSIDKETGVQKGSVVADNWKSRSIHLQSPSSFPKRTGYHMGLGSS